MGKPVQKSTTGLARNSIYYNYRKILKKEGLNQVSSNPKRSNPSSSGAAKKVRTKSTNRLIKTHENAKHHKKSKLEQAQSKEQREKSRLEKQQVRKERQKRINKRTKKGQPVMKNRMELMLEKIMKNKGTYQG